MVKLIAIWSKPSDVDGFEEDYLSNHLPIATSMEGLVSAVGAKVLLGEGYRIAELTFESMESLGTIMGSASGQKLSEDSDRLQKKFGVKLTTLIADYS